MLGDYIRHERQHRRWTQRDLAQRSGVAQAYISKLENDPKVRPSAEVVNALARAFAVPLEQVLQAAGMEVPQLPNDPRLARFTPEMLTELRKLYPDMGPDELEMALEMGVEALRHMRKRQAQPSQNGRGGSAMPGQEQAPADDRGEPPSEHRATARGLGRVRA